jgi:hypothetical protein
VVVTPDGTTARSPGSWLTLACARRTHDRPMHVVDLSDPAAAATLGAWLAALTDRGDTVLDLNVAGPRESELPGVYRRTRTVLERAWEAAGALAPPAG